MSAAPSAPTRSAAPSGAEASGPQAPAAGNAQTRAYAPQLVQQASPAPSWLDISERAGRVTVRAPAGLRRTAKTLANAAEDALARIATDLPGLRAPGPIEVRLVEQATDLQRVAPEGRGAPSYAVGVAYPDLGVVSIAMRKGAQFEDPEATLRHELAHIALGAALGDVPRWLHEGFAYQHSAEWSWERTETLAGMVWFHSIIPLNQLDRSFPAQEMATHRAYAESYDFVGFLSRRGRWDDPSDDGDRFPFRRFLAEIARTRDLDRAAVSAFGRPIAHLFQEWEEDLNNRLMFAPVGLFALALWVLAAILLVLGWMRRKRQARATLARWAEEEEQRKVLWVEVQAAASDGGRIHEQAAVRVEDPLAAERRAADDELTAAALGQLALEEDPGDAASGAPGVPGGVGPVIARLSSPPPSSVGPGPRPGEGPGPRPGEGPGEQGGAPGDAGTSKLDGDRRDGSPRYWN